MTVPRYDRYGSTQKNGGSTWSCWVLMTVPRYDRYGSTQEWGQHLVLLGSGDCAAIRSLRIHPRWGRHFVSVGLLCPNVTIWSPLEYQLHRECQALRLVVRSVFSRFGGLGRGA